MKFRERPEFGRGRAAELLVAGWLKQRGCYVIPSYDYSGEDGDKPPRLQGLWTGHPVPDLDACRDGLRFWVEVKSKGYSPLHRKSGEYTHGIEFSHLEHYRKVETLSGCRCWLFIFEEDTGWLLGQSLAALGEPRSVGNDGRGKRIAYWYRRQFRELERIGAGR